MGKLRQIRSGIKRFDGRVCRPQAKEADPFYLTPEYRRWRETVIARAGRQCEVIERSERCRKSESNNDRMFADHIKEVSDGGARYDPANGQCLCGRHHTLKTTAARAARLAESPVRTKA